MAREVIGESEVLLRELEILDKFRIKYKVLPYKEAGRIVEKMRNLAGDLPEIETPANKDELIQAELKRRLNGEAFNLEQMITSKHCDFETLISFYGVPSSDINDLERWLVENKDNTLEAIERLYKARKVEGYELKSFSDVPSTRRQAEEFAAVHIEKYHSILGKLLQDLTKVGEFLRDIKAVPTTEKRSYFSGLTKMLAVSIPAICYTNEDRSMQIREEELIKIYGHEGMGHALNHLVTKSNNIPFFLTLDSSLTSATEESVSQFYENVIFEDLKNSPSVQKALGIKHKFDEVYQEHQDSGRIEEYSLKLFQYAIKVLADKNLGMPQDPETIRKKTEILNKVTLNPTYPIDFVENYKNSFDSQGNLADKLVRELRYCAKPVQRALEEFAKRGVKYEGEGRSLVDSVLLKGFWTPVGYVDNARLSAEEAAKKLGR